MAEASIKNASVPRVRTPDVSSPLLDWSHPPQGHWQRPGQEHCSSPAFLTGLEDPLQVPIELPLNLLLPAELQEGPAVLDPLTLLGKLSVLCRGQKRKQTG